MLGRAKTEQTRRHKACPSAPGHKPVRPAGSFFRAGLSFVLKNTYNSIILNTMRKLLTLFVAALWATSAVRVCAQTPLPTGSPRSSLRAGELQWYPLNDPNFTVTDLNGNTHDFARYLEEGKKIIIDFSAVWCEPCMQVHKLGIMTDFYNQYGQGAPGSNEMIFWVEIQGAARQEIEGKNVLNYDWTDGGAFPVPIIPSKEMAGRLLGMVVQSVPTFVVIGSDGYYAVMYDRPASVQDFRAALEKTFGRGDAPKVTLKEVRCATGYDVTFRPDIHTTGEVKSYQWSFEQGTPATSQEAQPVVSWAEPGFYKVSLTVTDDQGKSATTSTEVAVLKKRDITLFPYREQFNDEYIDYNWRTIDADGDRLGWSTATEFFSQFGNMSSVIDGMAYSKPGFLCSWSSVPISRSQTGSYNVRALQTENYLITPLVKVPADALKPQFAFRVRSFSQDNPDSYSVLVSTGGVAREDFTQELKPLAAATSEKWEPVVLSLEPYKGKEIYIAIVHKDNAKSGLFIDDVQMDVDGSLAVTAPVQHRVTVQQIAGELRFTGAPMAAVRIYNLIGQAVAQAEASAAALLRVPCSGWSAGEYLAVITLTSGQTQTIKLTIR